MRIGQLLKCEFCNCIISQKKAKPEL
uniref:Uncharacterized protein n=1 Tax=Anguilla anguilla TaxID=7936 RepID=A0A0E9VG04_ANGAN